jgi:hypothetical protein
MPQLIRTLVASVAGSVFTLAVLVGQSALAEQVDRGKAKKVTSAQIKNGTIKKKDLSAEVTGPLARADSALQAVPDGSVTTPKLADDGVTGAKIPDGAVTGSEIATGAVTAGEIATGAVGSTEIATGAVGNTEIAGNSVTGGEIFDGSLAAEDIGVFTGTSSFDLPSIAAGDCENTSLIETGFTLNNDLILVSGPPSVPRAIQVSARQASAGSSTFVIVLCNTGGAFDPPLASFGYAVISN